MIRAEPMVEGPFALFIPASYDTNERAGHMCAECDA